MKKLLLFCLSTYFVLSSQFLRTAGGYDDTITQTNQQIATTANQRAMTVSSGSNAAASGSQTQNCQSNCASTDAATASFPYFIIDWYASATSTTPMTSFTFPTNQVQGSGGFWVNNVILIIHIFPPSNIVTATGITPISTTTNSYAIMYTLKSMDGTVIQKALQYQSTAQGATQATSTMPISSKGTPQIPTALSISTLPAPTTPPATTPPVPSIIFDITSFLPSNFSTSKTTTQQRILNAISPFSQKFLINSDSGSLTVTPLSGTFDTDDGTALVSSFSGQSGTLNPSGGTGIQPIQIILSDNSQNPIQSVTLGQKSNFTIKDLQNGLALNVHIFPPSTSSSQAEYIAFATLRTLDGLKLHKLQFTSFTSQPVELSIQYGSATTPQFATIFLNSTASQNLQAIGLISPMNLRCLLQQNSSGAFNVSML